MFSSLPGLLPGYVFPLRLILGAMGGSVGVMGGNLGKGVWQ